MGSADLLFKVCGFFAPITAAIDMKNRWPKGQVRYAQLCRIHPDKNRRDVCATRGASC